MFTSSIHGIKAFTLDNLTNPPKIEEAISYPLQHYEVTTTMLNFLGS